MTKILENRGSADLHKRELCKLGGAIALGLALPRANAARPRFSNDPFQMGVASGAPSADGFVLWTRIFGAELPESFEVRWEVFAENSRVVVAKGSSNCDRALGYAVHAEVTRLKPNQWYSYRFMVGGAESTEGLARTLPRPDTDLRGLRIAYASCQRWESGHYAAYLGMKEDAPDFVMFLGDYIYENSSTDASKAVRTHSLSRARTLDDFRDRYALYRSDPALQAMHAACPWLVTWDDHEVENNYSGDVSTIGTGRSEFLAVRAAAYQAYYENMPIRRAVALRGLAGFQAGGALRIHAAYDFGKLARIHLLDNRQYRSAPPCGDEPSKRFARICESHKDSSESMLGRQQENWLAHGLEGAKHQGIAWNLIGQQTRITPSNYPKGAQSTSATDSWAAYPESRQRLLDTVQRFPVNGTLIIGGDIHQNWVANVHTDPYDVSSKVVASEFCGTSISSPSNRTQKSAIQMQKRNPHCLLANSEHRGYGLVELTDKEAQVSLRVVRDVRSPASPIDTLARFRVHAGDAHVIPM